MNTDKSDYKISVILPCYNMERYIEETIKSVLNQSLKDFEIICLNDGSTDRTLQILNKYQNLYPNIRVISNENHGVGYERNIGIQSSKGKYIYYMDSDDLIKENCFETLYSYAEKDNLDIIYFEADSFYDTEEIKQKFPQFQTLYHRKKEYNGIYKGRDLYIEMENAGDVKMSVGIQFTKREFLIKNNIRFEEMHTFEDNLYTLQVMLRAERARCIKDNLYLRRVRNDSIMTGKKNKSRFEAYSKVIKELMALMDNEKSDIRLQEALYKRIRGTFINVYRDSRELSDEEKKKILDSESSVLSLIIGMSSFVNIEEKERKEISKKLKQTYAEKSEINAKLQQTYAEKSEINAKLKKAYEEKSKRGEKIKKMRNRIETQKSKIQSNKALLKETTDKLNEANRRINSLEREKEKLEKHLLVRVIKKFYK